MSATTHSNPRTVRTYAALLRAGQQLFSERPVDAVTVDDIVQAAGVGKGSFYNHFSDREALFETVASQIRAVGEGVLDVVNDGVDDPARKIARACCAYFRFALDDPERMRILVQVRSGITAETPLNRGLAQDLSVGLASRRFSLAAVDTGVTYVLGVASATLARVLEDRTPALATLLSQQMTAMMLRGLGLDAAEAELIAAQSADEIVRQGAYSARFQPVTPEAI